ncbi:P-loop containing nucleoside triphosphate hydrolase protein [Pseudomassariella vexata]|uniref:p-loop containing nucleoside triphosphate hydrolase protein n=1 Tax=Pseudomassariella vexata TaxID=1141098 RepID=A0A1Y2DPS4_9PEZI|nr:P-loop containing nucleoside triphosphate hydrolase protein [Pseudomassariella vexata]ORY61293.1 P-loop containing nucleoside triphosphate hydrolase protein [Pseudomassariella vexata]
MPPSSLTRDSKLRRFNEVLGEIQQLGISHVVPLPELVLIGDQPAGKSSLMSGLAKLDLPRSDGVCTRCPLHIRLAHDTKWQCRVSLQQQYDFNPPANGRPIRKNDVTARNPFPPWKLQTLEIKEFKTVEDRTELEDVLKWAQIATLNHNSNHELYIPGSGAIAKEGDLQSAMEKSEAAFSPNTVALEIKGPEVLSLSDEDMYLVEVVKNLALNYIKRQKALIIWAVPMNCDVETSSTFNLIRQMNAKPRTVGVMTKSDLLSEQHVVGLGYFITMRCPTSDLEDAERQEELFFDGRSGEWPQEFTEFGDKCGVTNLAVFLSEQLRQQFAKDLPSTIKKVKSHLSIVTEHLDSLPDLPANVELEVRRSLGEFYRHAEEKIDSSDFSATWRALTEEFRVCIMEMMKPKIKISHESDKGVIEVADSDDEAIATMSTPSKRPRQWDSSKNQPSSNKKARTALEHIHVKPENPAISSQTPKSLRVPSQTDLANSRFAEFTHAGKGFADIGQISEEMNRKRLVGLPNMYDHEVVVALCKRAVSPWKGPLNKYLEQTMEFLLAALSTTLQSSLRTLNKRLIYKESARFIKQFLDEQGEVQHQRLINLYEMEAHHPLTINEDAFKQYQREEAQVIERIRWFSRAQSQYLIPNEIMLKPLEILSSENRIAEQKKMRSHLAEMGEDPFKASLEVAANVRGYYKTAAMRFVDMVAISIHSRLLVDVSLKLPRYLDEKLGLHEAQGQDDCNVYDRLMEEDKDTAARRRNFRKERDMIEKAMEKLKELKSSSATLGVDVDMDNVLPARDLARVSGYEV